MFLNLISLSGGKRKKVVSLNNLENIWGHYFTADGFEIIEIFFIQDAENLFHILGSPHIAQFQHAQNLLHC